MRPTGTCSPLGAGALQFALPYPWLRVDLICGAGVDEIEELAGRLGASPGEWTPARRAVVADAVAAAVTAGAVCLLVRPPSDPLWPVPLVGCVRVLASLVATPEEVARSASHPGEASSAIGYLDGLPIVTTVRRQSRSLEVRYVVLCPTVTVTVELSASLTVDARQIVGEAAQLIGNIVAY
jgi:hypothetical protein